MVGKELNKGEKDAIDTRKFKFWRNQILVKRAKQKSNEGKKSRTKPNKKIIKKNDGDRSEARFFRVYRKKKNGDMILEGNKKRKNKRTVQEKKSRYTNKERIEKKDGKRERGNTRGHN